MAVVVAAVAWPWAWAWMWTFVNLDTSLVVEEGHLGMASAEAAEVLADLLIKTEAVVGIETSNTMHQVHPHHNTGMALVILAGEAILRRNSTTVI